MNYEGKVINGEILPTKDQIRRMPNDQFVNANPFVKQSCSDCVFMKSALSFWCSNKEAIKFRGTSIPGIIFCKFWMPDWSHIPKKYKIIEYGYSSSSELPFNTIWEKIKNFFHI